MFGRLQYTCILLIIMKLFSHEADTFPNILTKQHIKRQRVVKHKCLPGILILQSVQSYPLIRKFQELVQVYINKMTMFLFEIKALQ